MKIYYVVILFVLFNIGCERSTNNRNRLYFKINPENRKIILPVKINDSITANLTFDTGASTGCFHLDSSFCALHPSVLIGINESFKFNGGSGWSSQRTKFLQYQGAPDIQLGNSSLEFKKMSVYNYKDYYNTSLSNGMFNLPDNDTVNVWELNFEHEYLELHQAKKFKMPEDCFVTSIIDNPGNNCPINLQLPFLFTCDNGDTLTLNRSFMIDTAMSWDIVLMNNAKEKAFFNEKENARWLKYINSYFRYYIIKANLANKINIDSLRIYTFNKPRNPNISYFLGQNFLKRFNVFFDFNKRQVGFQPHNNFQRITNPNYRCYHYSTTQNNKGNFIVTEVGDYKENYYKESGLLCGDEIISVDGKLYGLVTKEEKLEFYKKDSLVYDLIRDGKSMQLVVKVNKNEKQGD